MIHIKKPEYSSYCTCCRKPFDNAMEVSFSNKDYNDSTLITLCGKCRAELMEVLVKADASTNSEDAADIHTGKWIPFKARPLTDEEKKDHPEWDGIWDCKLPEDGQEILVSFKHTRPGRVYKCVHEDEFYKGDSKYYLASGFELVNEAVAWMPKPEPWEGETEHKKVPKKVFPIDEKKFSIEKAIKIEMEIAKAREEFAEKHTDDEMASTAKVALRIASEHRRRAEWFMELVRLRQIKPLVEKIALEGIGAKIDALEASVPTKSALDNIHNVIAENAYNRGYDAGYKERGEKDGTCRENCRCKKEQLVNRRIE